MTAAAPQKKSGNDRPQPCGNKTEKGENQ